jgi:5-methylcytosine-specific restriction endonuclease McrA
MFQLRIGRPWVKPKPASHASRSHHPIYQTKAWKADRAAHLAAHPLCVECEELNQSIPATVSDHIIPIEQGGDVWDWLNRQPLCASHHNKKSAKERGGAVFLNTHYENRISGKNSRLP